MVKYSCFDFCPFGPHIPSVQRATFSTCRRHSAGSQIHGQAGSLLSCHIDPKSRVHWAALNRCRYRCRCRNRFGGQASGWKSELIQQDFLFESLPLSLRHAPSTTITRSLRLNLHSPTRSLHSSASTALIDQKNRPGPISPGSSPDLHPAFRKQYDDDFRCRSSRPKTADARQHRFSCSSFGAPTGVTDLHMRRNLCMRRDVRFDLYQQ
jgi:hypothetical protein